MFENHTILTKISYWLMALNVIPGIFTLVTLSTLLLAGKEEHSSLMWFLLFFLPLTGLNLYLAYKIFRRSFIAVKASILLYLIQIFSFETQHLSFYFSSGGLQFTLSWSFETFALSINIASLIIMIIIVMAYRSVSVQKKP